MEGQYGIPEQNDQIFPPADVEKELNPGHNNNFEVDYVSSQVAASKENKEQAEEAARIQKKEREKRDAIQTLKSALIVSGIVVALAGAAFAITKKLKEK